MQLIGSHIEQREVILTQSSEEQCGEYKSPKSGDVEVHGTCGGYLKL